MIGHASIQLTYDTYGHLMPDAFEGFGESLDSLVSEGAEALSATLGVTAGSRRRIR